MASFEKGPLARHLFFPAHYLSAWLGVYFPWTFGLSHIDDVPSGEILLRRFSNCNMANLTFSTVTGRLLTSFSLSQGMYRLPCGSLKEDIIKEAHEELSREEIEFIMAQVPGLLPSREGSKFWVEPYFPYRFARQFGFDQGCPEMPPEFPRSCREAGVGTWFSIWSRFQQLILRCDAESIL